MVVIKLTNWGFGTPLFQVLIVGRVPGLLIRACAGCPNNLAPRCPNLSAIDVTTKAIIEGLMLVSEWNFVAKFVSMPPAPSPPPLTLQLFLDREKIVRKDKEIEK